MERTESRGIPTSVFTAVSTIGLGAVIALGWMYHTRAESEDNREFLQTELIDALDANARASQEVANHIAQSVEIQRDLAEQVDDLGDESRALNRWVETFVRESASVREAQEALENRVNEEWKP